jgi:hypothetical protein
MPLRNLLVALLVLCALGGAVYWSDKVKTDEEAKGSAEQPKILAVPLDQIGQIDIKRRDGQTLTLKKGDQWQITAPEKLPVDTDAVNGLATAVGGLSADRVIDENNTECASFGLEPPVLEVTVTKRDGKATKLLIGDETATGSSVYARIGGENKLYTIGTFNKVSFDKTAQDMRDKRLLIFDSEKLTRVELAAKGQTVEFGRNSQNEWQLVKPRPLRADNWAVEELVRKIKDAKMDTTVSPEDAAKAASNFASGSRVAVARVTDATGTHELEVRKAGEDYFAKGPAVAGVHKVTAELGEGLDKGLDDFRNKKPFDFGFSDPTRIEVKGEDGQTKVYEKKDTKWFLAGKEMDTVAVQSLVDRLRELAATSFPESGFSTPVYQVKLTAKEGKLVDHVQFAKSGDGYIAQRVGEPTLYGIDTPTFDGLKQAASIIGPATPPPSAKDEKKK